VHFCHEWNTDYLYEAAEIRAIAGTCAHLRLKVLDVHASAGASKDWGSADEGVRAAGVELVQNRMEMARELGADTVVLHLPGATPGDHGVWGRVRRSLDELTTSTAGVRIALENMWGDDFARIDQALSAYDESVLGLCYDSGHGNIGGQGLDHLERRKRRLVAVHLHDNDGTADQHRLPFTGTVDWQRLACLLAQSSYRKCLNLEVSLRSSGLTAESAFLAEAWAAGQRLSALVAEQRPDVTGE
jgi:sugar phosphate isomerase/epimerase